VHNVGLHRTTTTTNTKL